MSDYSPSLFDAPIPLTPADKLFLAVDLGAGNGTRLSLFVGSTSRQLAGHQLHLSDYGDTYQDYLEKLVEQIHAYCRESGYQASDLAAIGIASAGILHSDGSFQLVHNLPHFNEKNLKKDLAQVFGVPAGIENDANAGGLAEWSVLQIELLYWVFGGGWGGVWISRNGTVMYPAHDWNGVDGSLHHTNEPGYSIPIEKLTLKNLFHEVGASWERMELVLLEDMQPESGIISGPDGNPDTIRAESILSGPGRCRLFRAIVGDDDFYERFLDIHETREMSDPSIAGQHISKLSSMRVEAAINTDRLYGKVLATATRTLLRAARKDGLPEGVPICLGGKPSYALPYFGPSAQRVLGKYGFMNYMRPSIIDDRGSNANLVGACVVAMQAYHRVGESRDIDQE